MASVQALFPTLVYRAPLLARRDTGFERSLLSDCRRLASVDADGQRWSKANYPGGYTSYASLDQLHRMSSEFMRLESEVDRHVRAFAKAQHWHLEGRPLRMSDCWANIMPRGTSHEPHLHPRSVVSGTFWVRIPRGAPGLKIEDPRHARQMAAPSRRARAPVAMRPHTTVPARSGDVVLFESWLRHAVAANPVKAERVSVSFNYHWS